MQKPAWGVRLSLLNLVIVILFAALAILAVQLRLHGFMRPIWLDEATHNTFVLTSRGFWDLQARLAPLLQPVFEFALRKYFWFPLFGHQEWGLRLPSLAASVVTVVLSAAMSFSLNGGMRARWESLAAGLFVGAWCMAHPYEIYYSAEARHYSFVACLSVLWTWTYLKLHRDSAPWPFLAAGLLFANSHFFAIPLVALACGTEGVVEGLRRNARKAIPLLLSAAAIPLGTITLNRPAWDEMLRSPSVQSVAAIPLRDAFSAAALDWLGYFSYLQSPGMVTLITLLFALILAFHIPTKEGKVRASRLALILLLGLPLLLLRVRLSSDYTFYARYYSPFFGLGAGALSLASAEAIAIARKLSPRHAALPPFLAAAAIFWITLPALSHSRPPLSGSNFTDGFRAYEAIKNRNQPIFVVASPCWNSEIQKLYFHFVGTPARQYVEYADQLGYRDCVLTLKKQDGPVVARLQAFLARHRESQVILYDQFGACGTGASGCLKVLERQRSVPDVLRHAAELGFPVMNEALLGRGFTN